MKKIILHLLFVLLILNIATAIKQDVFILNLKYDKGEISTLFLTKAQGYFNEPKNQPENGYRLEVISFDNKIPYIQRFDFSLEVVFEALPEWFDEKGNQIYIPNESETRRMLDEARVELLLPYFENAKKIDIYDKNNELKLSIDVSGFAKREAITTEQKSKEEKSIKKSSIYFLIFSITLFLIILMLMHLHKEKLKRNSNEQKLKNYIKTNLAKGYTKQQIKKELIKDDWPEDYIGKYLQ